MSAEGTAVRVLIADEEALFRSIVAKLIEGDNHLSVVGEAKDGLEAVQKASNLEPVLMDVRAPPVDGIEATRRILARQPRVRVLLLASSETDDRVFRALQAGAGGYILKDCRPEALISSIFAVATG